MWRVLAETGWWVHLAGREKVKANIDRKPRLWLALVHELLLLQTIRLAASFQSPKSIVRCLCQIIMDSIHKLPWKMSDIRRDAEDLHSIVCYKSERLRLSDR